VVPDLEQVHGTDGTTRHDCRLDRRLGITREERREAAVP
jgi:hypothetical protein